MVCNNRQSTAAVNNGISVIRQGLLHWRSRHPLHWRSIIKVTGINTATGWQITQATGQQIFFGTSSTTSGATETLTSSAIRDAIRIDVSPQILMAVLSSIGNITVVKEYYRIKQCYKYL